jgi:hypothetical protein
MLHGGMNKACSRAAQVAGQPALADDGARTHVAREPLQGVEDDVAALTTSVRCVVSGAGVMRTAGQAGA